MSFCLILHVFGVACGLILILKSELNKVLNLLRLNITVMNTNSDNAFLYSMPSILIMVPVQSFASDLNGWFSAKPSDKQEVLTTVAIVCSLPRYSSLIDQT